MTPEEQTKINKLVYDAMLCGTPPEAKNDGGVNIGEPVRFIYSNFDEFYHNLKLQPTSTQLE